jgi:hypothetical protein
MWGVMEAEVAGDEVLTVEAVDAADPALLAEAEHALRPLFRHCDLGHPAVDALFRYCIQSRVRKQAG